MVIRVTDTAITRMAIIGRIRITATIPDLHTIGMAAVDTITAIGITITTISTKLMSRH